MEAYVPTTPFGRRPLSLGQVASQMAIRQALEETAKPGSNAPSAINKWHVSRTVTDIRTRLGVSDRALSVLTALLSFHPETALTLPKPRRPASGDGAAAGEGVSCELVVFPSNKALAQRAHGMAPKTLWRHLSALVEAGLILRRDSPNGKRYARKDASGEDRFSDAFGFDLTPLVARAAEFETIAEEMKAQQKRRALTKERISLMRRDITKTIALALDEGLPGDWEVFRRRAMGLMIPLRRIGDDAALEALAEALASLRDETAKALELQINAQNLTSNDGQNAAHQSSSKYKPSYDLEPASKEEGRSTHLTALDAAGAAAPEQKSGGGETYPLGLVMEACPDTNDYAGGGRVRTWPQFLEAVATIRPMLGISPDAWNEAREVLGAVEAHIVVATILQRSEYSSEAAPGGSGMEVNGSPAIRSAGGYLRALTEQARAGTFHLGPVLMALIGQRLKAKRGRGAA